MRLIAISDIHGCLQTFLALLKQIALTKNDHLVIIGDYVDRGPQTKQLIDHILYLKANDYQIDCLMGNHEIMMLNAKADERYYDLWLQSGGLQTMDSFSCSHPGAIDKKYWKFLKQLEVVVFHDPYIFVHAGLNFNYDDPLSDLESMLWIRNWYPNINYKWLSNRYIVHGHTPTSRKRMEHHLGIFEEFRVMNVDGGCFHVVDPEKAHLCALDLTNRKLYFQKNIDDMSSWLNGL